MTSLEYSGLCKRVCARARTHNGNNNDKNIVHLIFYGRALSAGNVGGGRGGGRPTAVTIYAFLFGFKREVSRLYKFKLEFRDAAVCMVIDHSKCARARAHAYACVFACA